jgi:hypothetical protein
MINNSVNEIADIKKFDDVLHKAKVLANYTRENKAADNKAKEFARDLLVSVFVFEKYKIERLK